ncbi:unnamed protein product, partial [Rotaria sp. Silwood2]
QHYQDTNKLQFGLNDYCLSSFPVDLLQHSDIMADYIERISFVVSINPSNQSNNENQKTTNNLIKEEILETNAKQCVWIHSVTTFLLNAFRLNCTENRVDMTFEHRCRNKSIPFLLTDIVGTHDLLSYGQLSYDTILTSIESNNTLPLLVNVSSYMF